jgi:hypothetical protein
LFESNDDHHIFGEYEGSNQAKNLMELEIFENKVKGQNNEKFEIPFWAIFKIVSGSIDGKT